MKRQVPAPILIAAVALLNPFYPDLTPSRLVEKLESASEGPAPMPESMTIEEVGRIAKFSRATILRRLNDGTLPCVRVGRLVRIPRAAVEAMLTPAVLH